MIGLIFIAALCWLTASLIFFKWGYKGSFSSHLDEPRTKTNWNAIALFLNIRDGELKLPKRKTGIDKEIEEEEKEIAELERQKEKMDKLEELKRRKERLFKEVCEDYEETSSEYWICPQCRITFKDLEALNNHSEIEHSF